MARAIVDEHWGDTRSRSHARIVRSEGRRCVNNARAVFRGYEIPRNDAERLAHAFHGFGPIEQLLVPRATQFGAADAGNYLVFRRFFSAKMLAHQILRQHHQPWLVGVPVLGGYKDVRDIRSNREGRVGWECPRRSRPCQKVHGQVTVGFRFLRPCVLKHTCSAFGQRLELGYDRGVLDVAVRTRLVQFV